MTEETLFEQALHLPPEQRAAFLDRACAGDADLRARLDALLAAHFDSGPLPASAAPSPEAPTFTAGESGSTADFAPPVEPGTLVAGRYKLLQRIGVGGMGAVWMADQIEPVKRRVAVKLIRVERGSSAAILARFEAERQAIALMDHPHIARLLDAGTTEQGQPFFVMELVKGKPLTEFCDTHRLSIEDRLRLFVQVCQAVQHAHQKGIIHRDLKPSNVLVESHDGKPVAKVIDFGLAKATSGVVLTEHTLFTGFGSVLGTPLYMAPEQAGASAIDIDTRADVYALGVILYELLTGTTPLSRETVKRAAWDEIFRLVREQEAPAPSSRISMLETAPSVAANRQTEPRRLSRVVKGELDWIVLKALAKERERRYETASAFARDVERHLNLEPVSAGPPSTSYRIRKFIRRHRGPVLAVTVVLLALLVGVVGTTLGLLDARQARRAEAERADGETRARDEAERQKTEAEQQKERAQQEAKRAEKGEQLAGERLDQVQKEKEEVERQRQKADQERAVAVNVRDFLLHKLLGQADSRTQANALLRLGGAAPTVQPDVTVRQLLDRAAEELTEEKIEASFPGQPLLQAELLLTVGNTYRGVGEAQRGADFVARALTLRQKLLGAEHLETRSARNDLAMCYHYLDRLDQALPLFEESLRLTRKVQGAEHPNTQTAMSNLAACYLDLGRLDQGLPLCEETLRLHQKVQGTEHTGTLFVMNNLAGCYRDLGRLDQALPLYEETLRLRTKVQGTEHPDTLLAGYNLASCYLALGRLDQALPLFEETLRLRTKVQGAEHPDTLRTRNNLAECYRGLGRLDQALPLCEETLRLRKKVLGAEHPQTLLAMNNLAACNRELGRAGQALLLFEETLRLSRKVLGAEHPQTLAARNNLAECYRDLGRLDQALPLSEETLRLCTKALGAEHLQTLAARNNLAGCYRDLGRLDQALPLCEETLRLRKKVLGAEHPQTLLAMNNLAGCLWSLKRLDRSIPLFEESLALQEKTLGRGHPQTQLTVANLGVNYKEAGRLPDALPLLTEAYRSSKQLSKLRWVVNPFVEGYAQAHRTKELPALFREVLPPGSPELAGELARVGRLLVQDKAFADAEPLLRESLDIRQKAQPEAWNTFNTLALLGGSLLGQKKYAEAEPLLLKGYTGMKEREKTIPAGGRDRLTEAVDRLIELYTALDKPDEVKKWRAERERYPKAEPKPQEQKEPHAPEAP
jgi:serine/threonine protein kinase/tetratricopeptide (TPR) repeat protein